jgi:integration host factor subunit alpha
MKQTLEGGEDVLITGLGKFSVQNKSKRRGRNPQTGALLILPSRGGGYFQTLWHFRGENE